MADIFDQISIGPVASQQPPTDIFDQIAMQPQAPQPAPQRSFVGNVGRQAGLTGRYLMEGPAQMADVFAAPILYGYEKAVQNLPEAIGGDPNYRQPNYAQAAGMLADAIGLPRPEGAVEQIGAEASKAVAGGGGMLGVAQKLASAASPMVAAIGSTLSKNPSQGLRLDALTGGAVGAAKEVAPDSPGLQAAAGIATPFIAPRSTDWLGPAVSPLIRGSVRGGKQGAEQMGKIIDVFDGIKAETTPTVGQATQNPTIQGLEGFLGKMPFAGGVMSKKAKNLSSAIGESLLNKADFLDPRATATSAGRKIEENIPDVFVPKKQKVQNDLYAKIDPLIKGNQQFDSSNFARTLDELTAGIPGAQGLDQARILKAHPDIEDLAKVYKQASQATGTNGQPLPVPFDVLKQIRSRIGAHLENFSLVSDAPRREMNKLYGALSEDMKNAAKQIGPQALRDFNRANKYSRGLHSRIKVLHDVLDKNGGVENIFASLTSPTTNKFGASTLNTVMKSLDYDSKRTLVSAFIRERLGKALASQQDETGEAFSTQTFLTNYSKLSKEAKRAIFSPLGNEFVKDMDQIVKGASNLRESSRFFANPAGTGAIATNAISLFATIGNFFAGNLKTSLGLGATVGVGYGASKLLTNPSFVRWLAKTTEMPAQALPVQIEQLYRIGKNKNDEEIMAAAEALRQQQSNSEAKSDKLQPAISPQ